MAAAFYDVIAQRQLLEVARQSLERTEALQKSSAARLEVGLASKLDVFRAELQASQARDAMLRSQSSLATALERFRAVLALPPGDPVEPEAAALPATDDAFEPVEVLVAARSRDAARARRGARPGERRATRSASLAKQNLLPQVDLNVGVTQLGFGSSFGDRLDRRRQAGQRLPERVVPAAAGAASARRAPSPLLEVGSRRARACASGSSTSSRRCARRCASSSEIRAERRAATPAVEVADQQRRLAVLRYQRGLGSNFDVVDAESSLVTARSALVQLLTSYAVARLELKRTTGTLDVETEFAP